MIASANGLDTLVIDEISMVRADMLDAVDRSLRLNRGRLEVPFGGVQIEGVTVLEHDASSNIVAVAIHHRPLGPVLRFSAEIRDRLAGVIPADYFSKEST